MSRLLVADDNQENLYMLRVLLSAHGFQVETASNGVEALELARNMPPDIIVSDILMPVMDGYALCHAWKEDERLRNIPFVFYTATYTDPKDEAFALSLGADRFIIKPVEPDTLLALLVETRDSFKAGKLVSTGRTVAKTEYYKAYNAALIRKLEDKMLQLEEANRNLERDIIERKQAEEERHKLQDQMIQIQKMESIGRLAGGIAHDFNNMLSVILGYAQLAMNKVGPAQPLRADLEEIFKAAVRSMDITCQLLAFARKQTVIPVALDLNQNVENMLNMLRRLIGENIDLAWRPAERPCQIKIDPAQIDQILTNLCVNARDAIADVGRITIETENVVFDETYCSRHAGFVPGEYVLLAVSDDGCGMDRETIGHIFEPFFTSKEAGQGTGMGLSTVYGIVNQNNGFISVYSEPGKGTTFKIYLPGYSGEADGARKERGGEIPPGHGETVLVVEDEPALLTMDKMILEELGYLVLIASTPGEAVDLAEKHANEIDLVITDVIMPGMNGRDMANRIQSIYPGMKILFTSGYTADVIAHRGVLDEGVEFIQKPFSMKELAVKMRKVLTENQK